MTIISNKILNNYISNKEIIKHIKQKTTQTYQTENNTNISNKKLHKHIKQKTTQSYQTNN